MDTNKSGEQLVMWSVVFCPSNLGPQTERGRARDAMELTLGCSDARMTTASATKPPSRRYAPPPFSFSSASRFAL